MARRPEVDRRQADFFGAPAPAPGAPRPKPEQAAKRRPPPNGKHEPDRDGIDVIAARLSPAELRAFVAALPDDALACLVIATARQLRRRLVRGGKDRNSVLERAARQLIAELGGHDEGDDGW